MFLDSIPVLFASSLQAVYNSVGITWYDIGALHRRCATYRMPLPPPRDPFKQPQPFDLRREDNFRLSLY